MLDAHIRPLINPPLEKAGDYLAKKGIHPNTLTIIGFIAGVLAIYTISQQYYLVGLVFIILNRICDGLDGAIARATHLSDLGGFLDIVLDFIIYGGVVFGFALARPEEALWAAFLIFSYIGPISSLLAYAILAQKHQKTTTKRGLKSFYFIGGLCEGTETMFVMVLLCIFPNMLPYICLSYGIMCWITTLGRIYQACIDFS